MSERRNNDGAVVQAASQAAVQSAKRNGAKLLAANRPIPYRLTERLPGLAKVVVAFDPRAAAHVFDDETVSVGAYAVPDCERDTPIRWRVA